MEGTLLVASQLSSLFPASQGIVTPIPTSRRDLPLPPSPSDTDPPAEHASFSTVFHSDTTGTILLRVIHGGLTVELVSLTSDVPPIRFVFPALVLPAPGLFLSDDGQLHVLAITTTGSLYRLVLPATNGGKLWQEQFGKNWCREYDIKNATTEQFSGLVKAQGTHCVVVGLKNGSLLKLDTEYMGDDRNDGIAFAFPSFA
jgi:nuclear pore complex protein Nup160